MREKLNSNPVVQAVVIGVLGVAVAFLVFTRVVNQGGAPAPESTATTDQSAASATTAPATPVPTDTAAPTTTESAPAAAGTASAPATGAGSAAPPGSFKAGPGLPKKVVAAHNDNKVVVLLVVRGTGSDDQRLKAAVRILRARPDTEVFIVRAVDIAKYSRVTQGVDVNRTPALIVIEPKRLTKGDLPQASVSYGYRGLASAAQQVNDALYEGKGNLPYYP